MTQTHQVVWDWKFRCEDGLVVQIAWLLYISLSTLCSLAHNFLSKTPCGNVKNTNKSMLLMCKGTHVSISEVNDHLSDHIFVCKILSITRERVQRANIKLLLGKLTFFYITTLLFTIWALNSSRDDMA